MILCNHYWQSKTHFLGVLLNPVCMVTSLRSPYFHCDPVIPLPSSESMHANRMIFSLISDHISKSALVSHFLTKCDVFARLIFSFSMKDYRFMNVGCCLFPFCHLPEGHVMERCQHKCMLEGASPGGAARSTGRRGLRGRQCSDDLHAISA